MSQDSSFLKNTLDLIETDPEIKSFIYQQINEFNLFITPETLVMVIARDPKGIYQTIASAHERNEEDESEDFIHDTEMNDEETFEEVDEDLKKLKFRIAIILKDGEHSIEAEAYNNDIFEAIRMAKDLLVNRLIEIQEEVESPKDRIAAIQQASDNKTIH